MKHLKYSQNIIMKKPNDQLEKEQKTGEDIPLKRAQVASERVRSGAPSPAGREPSLRTR